VHARIQSDLGIGKKRAELAKILLEKMGVGELIQKGTHVVSTLFECLSGGESKMANILIEQTINFKPRWDTLSEVEGALDLAKKLG
jgi:hypothetical protein